MSKVQAKSCIKINAYEVVSRAVEDGVAYGYSRAFKHTDSPTEAGLKTEMENAVMSALCEVFIFGDER